MLVAILVSMNTVAAMEMYTQADLDNLNAKIQNMEDRQDTAHEMANNARELGLVEDTSTITEAKRIWLECHTELQELKDKAKVIKTALESRVYVGEFRLTAYCPCMQCCGKTNGITASGVKAVEGVTVAADIRKLPMGTRVYIEGVGERVVQDVGGAIKNNKLDIFVARHGSAFNAAYNQKAAKVWILK